MNKVITMTSVNKTYETIIVGGGVSGLSCARRLYKAHRDFLLITEELGGRLLSAKCCGVNYGAAYMTSDYANMLKFVEKKEILRIKDFFFEQSGNFNNVFNINSIKYIPKMIRFILILKKVRKCFLKYRQQATHTSVKECFENDTVLMKYWNMPATEFIKKYGLEELDMVFGNPVTAATAFIESDKVNAFYYIGMFFPVILKTWIVDLRQTVKKLTDGYENKIKIGRVNKVVKEENGTFKIKSTVGDFNAKNVVFAAPQKLLGEAYDLPKPFIQQQAYVFHLTGVKKPRYRNKKAVVFRPKDNDIFMMWELAGCADIIYSKNSTPHFEKYYERYEIIKKLHWDPGMIIPRGEIIKQKVEDNVYLASDYNLSLMEDCFLTGLYAANQIIGKNYE